MEDVQIKIPNKLFQQLKLLAFINQMSTKELIISALCNRLEDDLELKRYTLFPIESDLENDLINEEG